MSEQFKVGDICIFQNAKYDPRLNGLEVTIMALDHPAFDRGKRVTGYLLDRPTLEGHLWIAYPHQLRKKQPPRSAKSIMREAILKAQQPAKVPA